MQRIWVQLCGKNRHKVTILIMHKRRRGNWVFIDMINGGGCLPCWREIDNGVFNEGGDLGFRLHFYPSKQYNKVINIRYNAQEHDYVVIWCELHWGDLGSICNKLIEVDLKVISNSNSRWYSNYAKLHLLELVFCKPSDHMCDKILKCRWS